jgi:hypothetical protein
MPPGGWLGTMPTLHITMSRLPMPSFQPPPACRRVAPAALVTAALLAAALGTLAVPAEAATADAQPTTRRLTIQIDQLRQGHLTAGVDRGRDRLAQTLSLSLVLHSDGTLSPSNPLDPEDGKRQLERAQRAQQRVHAGLAAAQARGHSTVAAAPSAADIQALQAKAMQLQARCGNDRDCLMREASAMSAARVAGGDRALQARLQDYGAAVQACERSHGTGGPRREACIADARRKAGGGEEDDTARDEVVQTPYLHFSGRANCQLDVALKIDGRTEGSFEDVQGTVPFTQTVQAESKKRDDTRCPLIQVVLDTRDGRLWAHTAMAVPPVRGVTVRSEKGRSPQRHDGEVNLRWHEATDWLNQRLTRLDAGGEDQVRLPVGGGQNELRLRWRFEPA